MFRAVTYNFQPVCYAHKKVDGHRILIRDGQFLTRLNHDLRIKLTKYAWFEHIDRLSHQFAFDAELVTSLGAHRVKSYPDDLRVIGFASPDVDCDQPLEYLQETFEEYEVEFAPYMRLKPGWSVEELLLAAKEERSEGWVLKNGNHLDWYKLKVEETVDLYVVGVNPGKGKFHGLIGSLVLCDEFNNVRADCSGMTDEERSWLTAKWVAGKLLSRCVEIKHNGPTSRGRYRHPQFLRMRDDEK